MNIKEEKDYQYPNKEEINKSLCYVCGSVYES